MRKTILITLLLMFCAVMSLQGQYTSQIYKAQLIYFIEGRAGSWISIDSVMNAGSFLVDGQVDQAYKAEYDVTTAGGAWVHGMKVEITRAANVQPATGCWFGGQFVLNAGSAGYDDLDKPAYVIQAVFKGSDTSPNGEDIHVGRFETQSSANVSDIVYITANSGTTIQGHLLYIADHTGANGQLINVQSSQTMDKGASFMAGAGSTMTSMLYASGAGTFTNFLEVAASGDGGVVVGSMTNDDPNTVDEDGYLVIDIGGTPAKICFWYDN